LARCQKGKQRGHQKQLDVNALMRSRYSYGLRLSIPERVRTSPFAPDRRGAMPPGTGEAAYPRHADALMLHAMTRSGCASAVPPAPRASPGAAASYQRAV
jgi:hypothetical protein